MSSAVIVLEFNELVPSLMDRFIRDGHLPAFERLRKRSLTAVTDAEESPPELEPWIQWTTLHTGLAYAAHGVFELGEGHKLQAPRIWDLVSAAGRKVWICGSMNTGYRGKLNGHLLPDPWSSNTAAVPKSLFEPYHRFVSTYVQEHTRSDVPLSKADYARFVAFMLTNGLSLRTVLDAVKQLASEVGGKNRWRRATILDRLQWDVFRAHYRRLQPALATFFINSTAHFQHFHWRNMAPEAFDVKPNAVDQAEYQDAILYGYKKMDRIVAECLELAGNDTTVVLCTALSQQPMRKYEETGGKQLFRPRDVTDLVRFAGITAPFRYEPVMSDEFHLVFDSAETARDAQQKLLALHFADGRDFMRAQLTDNQLLASGFAPFAIDPETLVYSPNSEPKKFDSLFYSIGATSGMHHPDGILWISRPDHAHREIHRKVSLREIAPTLMECIGVDHDGAFGSPPIPELFGAASKPTARPPQLALEPA